VWPGALSTAACAGAIPLSCSNPWCRLKASASKSGDNSCSSHAGGIALLSAGGWPLWGPQVGRWIYFRRSSRSSMLRRHSYYPLALLDFLISFSLLLPIFWNGCVDEFGLKTYSNSPGLDTTAIHHTQWTQWTTTSPIRRRRPQQTPSMFTLPLPNALPPMPASNQMACDRPRVSREEPPKLASAAARVKFAAT
jgi:hypothetical protein